MRGAARRLALAALVLAGTACVAEPDPRPGPIRAMEPRPNPGSSIAPTPAMTTRERLRRNRWLTQFWEELAPAQRRLVEVRMRRARPPLARNQAEAQRLWDTMGLGQRDALVFGTQPRPSQPAPATAQDRPAAGTEGS
jgi:hypothetical protein